MGGDANRALGERDAEFLAHLARHPRVVGRRAGPGALVEAAEDEEVGLLQARLDEAPDRQAGMLPVARAHHRAGGERLE